MLWKKQGTYKSENGGRPYQSFDFKQILQMEKKLRERSWPDSGSGRGSGRVLTTGEEIRLSTFLVGTYTLHEEAAVDGHIVVNDGSLQ